ncbi:pentapeptide repeat-containing protein [Nostoc sp. FACHB-87]|nr:pentapeptide repeat-containing protein [Nostoc sp. FACHB-87]MBD2479549.1 pentapeptide repeat-containing protein [Anabaena sp. FACHB-83]
MPQDFSGHNLRGRSFKGQNLEGANFTGADIRSADFTGANLRGANFSHATAGLQKRWAIFLLCVSWLLSGVSGFFSAFAGVLITYIFDSSSLENQVGGWTALIVIIVVFLVILRQGFNSAFAVTVAVAFIVAGSVAFTGAGAFAGAGVGAFTFAGAGAFTVAGAIAFAGAVTAVAVAGSVAGAVAVAGAFAVAVAVAAVAGSVAGAAVAVVFAGAVAGAEVLISSYIAWRAMKGDKKYFSIRNIAVAFAASCGASFRSCDLTDANFTAATLKSTDFRKANLTRTCFHKTKKLDRVRPGTTYLQKAQVVSVLVTGQGQDKNFDREDLQGVNFQGADLVDASFIGADLSQSNLQDADLSRAKLVQTQLNGTDLTGATLTGAYIQDWGITTDTKFDGVRCEYVYMRLPTKENPDPLRKPDNYKEVFADGEFGDFIQPIFDTLDLYHNQGVDPRAIAISFKQLAENHPDADLRIVGMEVRGEDKFLLRAKTAAKADKSELSAEYFDTYNEIKGLPEREIKLLLEEKDSRIRSLENFVNQALQRPNFYSSTQIEKVNTMTNNPGGISQNVSGGNVSGGMQASQGNNNVQTSTTYSSPEQKQNLAEAAAEIQALLEQLSQSYPTNTMAGKMALATEATQRIENNPTLMQKTISALRAGGTAALEQALSHPAASFVIAALDDWNKNNQ